ncbi:MAG TPA: hypothetical protein VK308_02910 [Pyrinomonadaceae bacterium]|nr:hypothetical protein [Pyrinomonadaceae bacterium]
MRYIQILFMSAVVLTFAAVASAQTEDDLKNYFEGKRVEVKIDMPATKDGINIYPEKARPLDYSRYASLIKNYGLSVLEGDRIMITKIKVKDKHVEFHLGGGGYGTFGDETSSSVYVPTASKSRREKNLEKDIKYETDERRRRQMREELDYLRRERRRDDSQNRAQAAVAEEIAKVRIEKKRLQGGSRFNIRFDRKVTAADLTPQAIMDALAEYLYFSDAD